MVMLRECIKAGARSTASVDPFGFIEVTGHLQQAIDRKLGYLGEDRFVFFRFAPHCDGAIWSDSRSSGFGYGAWIAFDDVLPLGRQYGVEFGARQNRGEPVLVVDRQEHRVFIADRLSAEELVDRQPHTIQA